MHNANEKLVPCCQSANPHRDPLNGGPVNELVSVH